ncbi:hypothetical protein [Micromonospora chalcea]|uniref:hypothetical protein n=1 Tax=Micromonospora chalcea TaxID=1874 RepID=UPI003D724789
MNEQVARLTGKLRELHPVTLAEAAKLGNPRALGEQGRAFLGQVRDAVVDNLVELDLIPNELGVKVIADVVAGMVVPGDDELRPLARELTTARASDPVIDLIAEVEAGRSDDELRRGVEMVVRDLARELVVRVRMAAGYDRT